MKRKLLLIPLFLLVIGCSGGGSAKLGKAVDAMPPIEKGCLYIAVAILVHGAIS